MIAVQNSLQFCLDISKGTQRPSNLSQILRQRGMIERELPLIDHELERFHRVNILQEKQTNKQTNKTSSVPFTMNR